MAKISMKHLYKVYPNGTKAVNDFDMQIEDREFIVFVGPSGCGKSTTLRMIAGLEEITAGELKIGDVVVNGLEPKDRDIAMVFQNYALYPHMTIYDNIAFGLEMRKTPKKEIDRRVHEAAALLGITEYLRKKPKEMSGGQRQRVALGRAIVREPKVMLLDEPLSNLDAKLRTQMRSEIVKLHKKLGTTFIYVTHDQVEAMTMGTRIVVMKDGFIKQIDTPKNLYKYPANQFVAGFIGTPQMNFFEVTLKKDGDSVLIDFAHSEAKIRVPYRAMTKVPPEYLQGTKPATIGFRAEDISLDPEKVKASRACIPVRISHTEELGTETLVYGDIDLSNDDFGESNTRVIVKAAGFNDYESGAVLEAAFDLNAMHLFDRVTEESILPRIPEYNAIEATVKDGTLIFAGIPIRLPPAMSCTDGECEGIFPVSAVNLNGDIPAKVVGSENVNGQFSVSLDLDGIPLFALSERAVGEEVLSIGIDFKQLTIKREGKTLVERLPSVNRLYGTFEMEKAVETVQINGKKKKKKTQRYFFVIGDGKFAVPEETARKMCAAFSGRKVFNTSFRFEGSPYDIAVGECGITAEVVETLDYGAEKFLKCRVGEEICYVYTEKAVEGVIRLVPNIDTIRVVERQREIRIV